MSFGLPAVAVLAIGYFVFGGKRKRRAKIPQPPQGPVNPAKPWRARHGKPEEEEQIILDLDPRMRAPIRGVLADLRREGHDVLLIYGRRSTPLQTALAEAKTGLRTGSSHPKGLAVDIVATTGWWEGPAARRLWPAMGRFAKQRGFVWGGDWKDPWDPAHIQWKG